MHQYQFLYQTVATGLQLSASELGAAQAVWAAKSGKGAGHKAGTGGASIPIPVSNGGNWAPAPSGGGHSNAPIYYPSVPNSPIPAPHHTGGGDHRHKPNQPAPVVDKNWWRPFKCPYLLPKRS